MAGRRALWTDWTLAQRAALLLGAFFVVLGIVGLIANPDFATGGAATAERALWIDWNGWHAVGTLALAGTGIACAFDARAALYFAAYAAIVDLGIGVWTLVDSRPLRLLNLPTDGDTVLHFVVAAIFGVVLFEQLRRSRRPRPRAA